MQAGSGGSGHCAADNPGGHGDLAIGGERSVGADPMEGDGVCAAVQGEQVAALSEAWRVLTVGLPLGLPASRKVNRKR